jgi:hypothetical protein
MCAAEIRRDAALRGPVDEAEPQQEWFVDVLDRVDLLRQHGRQRGDADRTLANFWTIAASSLRSAESRPSSSISIRRMRRARGVSSTVPSPWTWAWSRTRLSSRFTMRGVPRPRRAIARVAARRSHVEDLRRAFDDRGELVLGVEVEAIRGAEAVAQRRADAAARVVAPTTVNGLRLSPRLRADGPLPIITSRAKSSIAG